MVNSNRINAVVKNKQPPIAESSNTDLSFTKIIKKSNAETAKFNKFQIDVPSGEFSKWLDNGAEDYFDYPESLNTSLKYPPIPTNMKATSTETTLNKEPDKSASIKTYIESDYKDLNLKWPNDEEYEFSKDLKKFPRTWQDDSAIDEATLIPPEWDLIDKITNDNNNAISNANLISKTTASRTSNLETVSDSKDIYIPSDWIVKYNMMNDKNDDILFSKIASSAENHAGANSKTRIVSEDEYKPLKSIQTMVQMNNDETSRSGTDDAISKSKQVVSTAIEAKTFVSGGKQKLSTWAVDDAIVNDKNNIAVAAKSITLAKSNAGNDAISENDQKLIKWNTKNAIISDKNSTKLNGKAITPTTAYPVSDASNESKRESSQYSMKNNAFSNQTDGMSKIKMKANATVKEKARVQNENNNEQLRKTVTQNSMLNNKNNSTIAEEGILYKIVNSGVGVTYPAENSDIYSIQVPSEWIVKYESLGDKDDSLKLAKVMSTNPNARNIVATEDASNWTNEPKVTRERDDKWSGLETNAKTSAIQTAAISTEKIEKLPNKRIKDNTQINKAVESTKTDAEAATVNNNDNEQWNNDKRVQSLNSQSAVSTASNVEVGTTIKNEKEQWKWNDTDKNLTIKNDVKSDNNTTMSVETGANAAVVTDNKYRQWNWNSDKKTQSMKDKAILNTNADAFAAGNTKAAASVANNSKFVTATQSKQKQWNWAKNNRVANMKNYDISNSERAAIGKSTYDTGEVTTDKKLSWISNGKEQYSLTSNKATTTDATIIEEDKQKWKRNNELKNPSVKDNAFLNNRTETLTVTNNVATAGTESEMKQKIWNNGNKILSGKKVVASSNKATATAGVNANSQSVIEDDKQQRESDNKENTQTIKESGSPKNVTISSAKANANGAKSIVSDKKTWKWDCADKVSSNKYDYLTANETELTSGTNVTAASATDANKILLKFFNEKENVISNSKAIATVGATTKSQTAIEDENFQSIWNNKENAQLVKNNGSSNDKTIPFVKADTNDAKSTANNKRTWQLDRADEVSNNKYDYLTANERDSSLELDVKAAADTDTNKKLLKLSDKNENLSEKRNVTINSKVIATAETSTNFQATIEDKNQKWEWNNKENAKFVRDNGASNSDIISSAEVNANASASKNQTWKWERADEVSSDKYDYLTTNERDSPSKVNVTVTATTDDNKKSLKLNDKNKNLNEKENIISNSKAIPFTHTIADVSTVLKNSKNQLELKINSKSQVVKDDLIINNQSAASAVSNANFTSIIARNQLQSKSDDENKDVTSNNKTIGSAEADSVPAVVTESELKQRKFEEKNKNLSIKNNVSVNIKTTVSAGAKTDAATIMTDGQQQWRPPNEDKILSVKDDAILSNKTTPSTRANADAAAVTANSKQLLRFNDENDDILNLGSAASVRANRESADAAAFENQRISDDRKKNPRFIVDITSNTEKAASTRTNEETETGVTLITNNDNRKIFGEKTSEVTNLESISETFPSTIDTAKTNLENKDKNTSAEYNVYEKGAWIRKDFVSNSMIATAATKASSACQNKEKSSDRIAETSTSRVPDIETDSINENKEKLQNLGLKNSNSIEHSNSTAAAGVFANIQIESSTSKERENKPSDRYSKRNNVKDDIDAMTVTEAITYINNKGDVDTLSNEDTKLPEWKIKETNEQSHQDLIVHRETTVSAKAQAKADSVMGDQNKPLNIKVEHNNSYNNDLSIANISTAAEANVDPSIETKDNQSKYNGILKDTEISKNLLENIKTSALASIETEMVSVNGDKNKQFVRKIDNKNLMNNSNSGSVIEVTKSIKAESNSVSTSNDTDKQMKWKYKDEDNVNAKDSVTDGIIDNGSNKLAMISSKEKNVINSLNKTSNNLVNWLLRWRSINVNAIESNKNERQNDTELNNWKLGSSNNEKYTINELDIPSIIDDKMKVCCVLILSLLINKYTYTK